MHNPVSPLKRPQLLSSSLVLQVSLSWILLDAVLGISPLDAWHGIVGLQPGELKHVEFARAWLETKCFTISRFWPSVGSHASVHVPLPTSKSQAGML